MRSYGFLAATAVMLAPAPAVEAQDRSAPRTVGLGDPVRAALIETLRTAIARTRCAEQQAEGMLDGDTVTALLRETRGKWSVVTFAIGPPMSPGQTGPSVSARPPA